MTLLEPTWAFFLSTLAANIVGGIAVGYAAFKVFQWRLAKVEEKIAELDKKTDENTRQIAFVEGRLEGRLNGAKP